MRCASALLAAGTVMMIGACDSDDEPSAAAACLGGGQAFVEALETAPEPVTLDGTTLGDCLAPEQAPGQLATVGEAMVAAATDLNARARKEPLGDAPVQLGYLVGAVDARAAQTGGIHEDLALRVESAAAFIPNDQILPGGYQQRYEEGLAAGRASG